MSRKVRSFREGQESSNSTSTHHHDEGVYYVHMLFRNHKAIPYGKRNPKSGGRNYYFKLSGDGKFASTGFPGKPNYSAQEC